MECRPCAVYLRCVVACFRVAPLVYPRGVDLRWAHLGAHCLWVVLAWTVRVACVGPTLVACVQAAPLVYSQGLNPR